VFKDNTKIHKLVPIPIVLLLW